MSYINIYTNNLHHNINFLAKKAGGIEKIMAVLKDNAYGHGLSLIASKVSSFGVTSAITRDFEEALKIENFFENILVLSEHIKNIKPHSKIIFTINSLEDIVNFPKKTRVALKVDTGMHRSGIKMNEFLSACKAIEKNELKLHSIFTHYRSADEVGSDFFWQKQNFNLIKNEFNEIKHNFSFKNILFHSCNSAGLLRAHYFDEDLARIGIAMYGYTTLPKSFGVFDLKPVLELFAEQISSRKLLVGEKVGYGGEFCAHEEMISSLYDLGYGDGLFRYSGKKELKTTDGSLFLGRFSMDNISINSEKKAISIFHDVSSWTDNFETIVYDQLVKLSPKIERRLI